MPTMFFIKLVLMHSLKMTTQLPLPVLSLSSMKLVMVNPSKLIAC